MGTCIDNRSSVKLSATGFLIPRLSFGVTGLCGVPGVLVLFKLPGVVLNMFPVDSRRFELANFLAAGDIVLNLVSGDAFGFGEGL